jgi:hypothetical protein
MSYRNPQIIVDRSAEIYAQAASNLGSQMVGTVQNIIEKQRLEAEGIKKRNEAFQLAENNIRLKEYEDANKTSQKIKGSSLQEQFKNQYIDLLEGENGSIRAKSILSTSGSSLTTDQRKQYFKIIDDAENFKNLMLEAAGSIEPDIQEYKENVTAGAIGSKYMWKGSNNFEKYQNMLGMNALADQEMDGVTYTKELKKTDSGSVEIIITNKIDTKSDFFKKLEERGLINKNDLETDKSGYATVTFAKDLKKYGDGLLTKIPENIDNVKALQTAGLLDKNGKVSDVLLNEKANITVSRQSGTKQIIKEELFDPSAIKTNKVLNDEFKSFASGVISRPLDEQLAYVENVLGISNYNYSTWEGLTPAEKQGIIKDKLIDNAVEQIAGTSFKKRFASKKDVSIYNQQGKALQEGEAIYTKIEEGPLSYDTPQKTSQQKPSSAQNKQLQKQEIQQEGVNLYEKYKQDPVGTYEMLTGVAPFYNKDTNVITIKAREGDDKNPDEYIKYDMSKPAERNRFYKRLLEETQNAKGSSEYARLLRSSYENTLMEGTKKKLNKKKQEGVAEGDALFSNE